MGGEPWLIRKTYDSDPKTTLSKHREDIQTLTPDWPEIRIGEADQSSEESFFCLLPFLDQELIKFFGSQKPQSTMTENEIYGLDFWEEIERGQGRYIVLFAGDEPRELCFLGYSCD